MASWLQNTNDMEEQMARYPSLRKMAEADDGVESHDGREERLLTFLQTHPQASDFRTNPSLILDAIDHFSGQHDFLISIGENKRAVVADLIASEAPAVLVELGGYMGYSAVLFALEMRRAAAGRRPVHVWSLEFEPRFADMMREVIALGGLQDVITVVVGPAADSLRELRRSGQVERIDLLFIDHVEELYEQDFKVAMELGLLRSGACVLADNIIHPGAPKYREFVRGRSDLKSEGVDVLIMPGAFHDELEVTKVL